MLDAMDSVNPEIAMTIGSDKGGDAYMMLMRFPLLKTLVINEIRGVPYVPLFRAAFPSVKIVGIHDSSRSESALKTVKENAASGIDAIFLDGEKAFFMEDFNTYLPLMSNGSIVAMHDINPVHGDEPMPKVWSELKKRHRTSEIVDVSEWHDMRDSGRKPATSHDHWLATWKDKSCGVGVVYL